MKPNPDRHIYITSYELSNHEKSRRGGRNYVKAKIPRSWYETVSTKNIYVNKTGTMEMFQRKWKMLLGTISKQRTTGT